MTVDACAIEPTSVRRSLPESQLGPAGLPPPAPADLDPARPVWFGGEEAPLLGWVHAPAAPTGAAAVLCPPLYLEHTLTHPSYLCLARQLAGAGILALRFDYQGTGDSAGSPSDPDQVAGWLASVDRAMDLAQSLAAGPVALVGMRMGALLAAIAAGRRGDVEALVLWDPCLAGRTFLRRHRSLHALHFGSDQLGGAGRSDGAVEVPGMALSPATAAEIAGLRLPAISPAPRTLVLVRPGRSLPAGYRAPRSVGEPDRVVVGTLDRGEQEELLDASRFTRRAPASGLALAGRWLAANLDRPTGAIARRLTPDDVGVTARRAGHAARMTVEVGGEARTVRERAVRLGPLGLFGVETLPDPLSPTDPDRSEAPAGPGTRRAAERPPVVVFLSSGNDSHIGPSRLWVSLGRRWAAAGFRCVRVDLSGLGESPAREGQAEQVLRPPEAFDDVLDVAAAVAEDPKDVVLVGLCSGAYQALDSALELAPLGVLAINPVMRFVPPEVAAGGRISERRQLCIPRATWSVALRSRLPKRTGDRVAAMRAIWERWRPRGHRTDWRARFLQRGVQVYCICGEQEAGPFRRHGAGMPEASGSSAGMQVEAIAGLDHALLAAGHRELVVDRLTEALHRMTGR